MHCHYIPHFGWFLDSPFWPNDFQKESNSILTMITEKKGCFSKQMVDITYMHIFCLTVYIYIYDIYISIYLYIPYYIMIFHIPICLSYLSYHTQPYLYPKHDHLTVAWLVLSPRYFLPWLIPSLRLQARLRRRCRPSAPARWAGAVCGPLAASWEVSWSQFNYQTWG